MKRSKALQKIQPSYIREILAAASSNDVISLAGGLPDDKLFPLNLMEASLQSLASNKALFQYGITAGYQLLLDYCSRHYQLSSHHQTLICTGSQQGLDLIARAFIDPKDVIVMEAPSYLGALQVFGLSQATIQTVQQGDNGPDLAQLEQCFANQQVTFFYAVPDFHNPTGVCWTTEVRIKVAQLCQQYQVTLIEDVPYRELRFSGNDQPLVSSFCPESALVLRSFSKIATPGIRLGIVTGKADWLLSLNKVKQCADLHSSLPMQSVLLDLLQHTDFNSHLHNVRKQYKARYQQITCLLAQRLPQLCHPKPVEGGMFIWLTLPPCDINHLAASALENGVAVVPSSVFYPLNINAEPALRLNFTHASEQELRAAIERLAVVIERHCQFDL